MGDWEDIFGANVSLDDLDEEGFFDTKYEEEFKLKEEYNRDLLKGSNTPKKSYHNSKITKFGFNNFKPFGKKIQTFTKKPITLIYGPNSIGKSSFIHMDAYNRYIHKTKNLDLINTDMFGDNINIGGFEKFIHKRNKNSTLTLEYQFNDCSEAIIDYCNINKELSEDVLKALLKFSVNEIENIIKNSEQYVIHELSDKEKTSKISFSEISDIEKKQTVTFRSSERDDCEDKKKELLSQRKNNHLCNIIYPDEIRFLNTINIDTLNIHNYYQNKKYIYSTYSTEMDSNILDDDMLDTIYYKLIPTNEDMQFLNKENKFVNINLKKIFISDILIPLYINQAKFISLLKRKNLYIFLNKKPQQFNDIEVRNIAEKTLELISELSLEHKFLQKLQQTKIALRISANIHQSSFSSVKYYIDNIIFDERDSNIKSKIIMDDTITSIPEIFQSIPTQIYNKIYNKSPNAEKNKLHKKSTDILFLSFKNGYDSLFAAFNDMIGFNEMQYIGPLRFYPERDSSFKELDSNISIMPDSQTSWSYLKQDTKLREKINKWLKNDKKLKTPYEIKYRKLYDLESSLYDINFDKLIQIQKEISKRNEIINKYSISSELSEISKELEDDLTELFYNNYEIPYISVERVSEWLDILIQFSKLCKEKQYKLLFEENGILKNIEYKEEMVFEDMRAKTQISNRDLGLGISQILPVLIATNRQKNMTIAIEQPELHLHPAVQCEIADEIIRSYKENNNNFIIETHSEHLLLRIMKRMRHTAENKEDRDKSLDLTPDDICLLYVDSNGKTTFLNELELAEDGSLLDRWPNGFFEEGHRERFD